MPSWNDLPFELKSLITQKCIELDLNCGKEDRLEKLRPFYSDSDRPFAPLLGAPILGAQYCLPFLPYSRGVCWVCDDIHWARVDNLLRAAKEMREEVVAIARRLQNRRDALLVLEQNPWYSYCQCKSHLQCAPDVDRPAVANVAAESIMLQYVQDQVINGGNIRKKMCRAERKRRLLGEMGSEGFAPNSPLLIYPTEPNNTQRQRS